LPSSKSSSKAAAPPRTAAHQADRSVATHALDIFAEFFGKWEKRYPAIIRLWENAWAEFVPFLAFGPLGGVPG
jgi:transposase-like protein